MFDIGKATDPVIRLSETRCIPRGNESHWHSASDQLHENPLKALLKATDNPKPASEILVLRRNNAKNEGAGEAGGGCCPRWRDGVRRETSGRENASEIL